MCGITGIWHLNGERVEREKIERFNDSLAHRGPDGRGISFHDRGALSLGHRRLSILDLSEAGKQPMTYADGKLTITFNGEIFNFLELRTELITHGYSFKSESDTEVVLAAYHKWGIDCFNRFNGMWAMAIWDENAHELILCRDRFGIKPLYYTKSTEQVAFASETFAYRFLNGFNREIAPNMVSILQNDEYALEGLGYTMLSNVFQILPGHYAVLKAPDKSILQKRWYSITDNKSFIPKSFTDQVEKFYSLLQDSCKLRLQSDVPLATALSGGLDSSSVLSLVSGVLKDNRGIRVNENSQRVYTATFPYLKSDELSFAKRAARFLDMDVIPVEESGGNLGDEIWNDTFKADYIGRPITSLSHLYRAMKKDGVSVSMDGHGVDEMLYGYRNMVYGLYNYYLYTQGRDPDSLSEVLINMYHEKDRAALSNRFLRDKQIEKSFLGNSKRWIKQKIGLEEPFGQDDFMPIRLPNISNDVYRFEGLDFPERMLYHQFFQHTLPSLLRNFDRAGMINGVEIRMPFMDYRLVEFVFSLPMQSKIGNGFTKLILREAMKGKLDEEIRTRTYKVGIMSPMEYWFNNQLKEWMMDTADFKMRQYLNSKTKAGDLSNKDIEEVWNQINYKILSRS